MAKRGNPYHEPAGSPHGGEFASGRPGVGLKKKYEIKKAKTKRGDTAWGVYDNGKPVSWHGDRGGAQVAIKYLNGEDPSAAIAKRNFRWVKNLADAMR